MADFPNENRSPEPPGGRKRGHPLAYGSQRTPGREYAEVAAVLALVALASWFVVPHTGYLTVGFFFLLAVIILSLRVGPGPVVFAGVASALTWNFFFIPPAFTLAIARSEDALMLVTYFVVSLVSGLLTARVRKQALNERMREERATALLRMSQAVSAARTLDDTVTAAMGHLETHFGGSAALLLGDEPPL